MSDYLRTTCEPLPILDAMPGKEMRSDLLKYKAKSDFIHNECIAKHIGVMKAVGVEPIPIDVLP